MQKQLSKYKFKKIAVESFKNGLRLHFDSILLYEHKSYPSGFQLSVLALEEFSKSHWVEHYYYSSKINGNFPDRKFEQEWLKLLYLHPRKQKAFFGWGVSFHYRPNFIKFVEEAGLEIKKQKATYVGFGRKGKDINVDVKISIPTSITQKDAKQIISLINDHLKDCCEQKLFQEFFFDILEKDLLLDQNLLDRLYTWRHRSGLRTFPSFKSRKKKSGY